MRSLPAILLAAAATPAFAALRIPNAPSSSYTRAPANSTPSKLLAKLYVSSYDGNITTFHLGTASKPTEIYFSPKSKNTDCGAQPTWMNFDRKNKALYCINEQWNPDAGNATYNKLSVDKEGKLTLAQSVNTTYGGPVHAVYMPTTKCGSEGYHVIAHYSPGGVSVLDNKLSHVSEKNLTIGPFDPVKGLPNQQGSHAHQAILDPKGDTVFIPDLGQDKIFMADIKNNKYDSFEVPARTGPRHGVFAPLPGYGNRVGFYVIGEISNKIEGFELTYTTDGKVKMGESLTSQSSLNAAHKEGYAAGELTLTPDRRFLIASNRNNSLSTVDVCADSSYASCKTEKADTLVTFKPSANGTLEHVQTWSAGGMLPRSFSLNAKGDMIAVGLVSRVVVMQRDVKTGMIGDVVAEGMFEGEMAVTNVVWDEDMEVAGGWFYGGQGNVY